jgi:hypothetical protein
VSLCNNLGKERKAIHSYKGLDSVISPNHEAGEFRFEDWRRVEKQQAKRGEKHKKTAVEEEKAHA